MILDLLRAGDRVRNTPVIARKRRIVGFRYGIGDYIGGGYVVRCFYDFEDMRYPAYELDSGGVVLQKDVIVSEVAA